MEVMARADRASIHDAMVRLADGDRSAFAVLLDRLWPVILAFARRALDHEQDSEDVAQEVFVRICSRMADFDRSRDGLSWAFGIAQYEIMTLRRSRQRRRETSDEPSLRHRADARPTPEERLIEGDLLEALSVALGELSESDRLVLVARSPTGTGADTDVARSPAPVLYGPTERKRRQRALGRLRILWRRLYGEP
jgi:RNA polymerase sigma-70 factor (ECF subfamily)